MVVAGPPRQHDKQDDPTATTGLSSPAAVVMACPARLPACLLPLTRALPATEGG